MRTSTAFVSTLAFFSSLSFAAPIPNRAYVPAEKRQASGSPSVIGVSVMGSTTIAGAAASDFASAAGVAAVSASSAAAAAASTAPPPPPPDAAASSAAPPPPDTSSSAPPPPPDASSAAPPPPPADKGGDAAAAQDLTVLNLAFTLEQLETSFYKTGLATFSKKDMIKAGLTSTQADIIIQTFSEQLLDESTHTSTLKSTIEALGGKPATSCQFDFSAVLSNPATFISAARTLELVGVAAYAGAANLISDKTVLTAAATILSVESRHQSGLNLFSGGTFTPGSFDFALRPEQVLALSGSFLKGCSAKDLGLTANQPLSAIDAKSGTSLIAAGTQLAFASPVLNSETDANALTCQMLVSGQPVAIVQPLAQCVVPKVNGPVMVYVTNDPQPLQSNIIEQNTAQIVAGPAAVFIDASQETFQALFSVQGFGISTLASFDMGAMSMNKGKKVDIIEQSKKTTIIKEEVVDGMIMRNRKRGFESAGAKILGWK